MDCIIIGNGSTLLNKKHGEIIDKFDDVVRFNAYTIKSYEDYVGTKTTTWFNVINYVNKDAEWRMTIPYKKIYLHSWQWDTTKDKLYIDFMRFYNNDTEYIEKTNRSTLLEMQEFNNVKYSTFSTGAISIWLMLKIYKQIYITGFDWWDNDTHHYNDRAPRGTIHKPQIEKSFIDKLISQGRIIMI